MNRFFTVGFLTLILAGTAMSEEPRASEPVNVFLNYEEERIIIPNRDYRLGSSDWPFEFITTSEISRNSSNIKIQQTFKSDTDDLYDLRPSWDVTLFGLEGTLMLTENKDEFFRWKYRF